MKGPPSVGVTAEAYNKINTRAMHRDFLAVKIDKFYNKKKMTCFLSLLKTYRDCGYTLETHR